MNRIEAIEKAPKAQGKSELLKHLAAGKLRYRQAVIGYSARRRGVF